MTAMSRLGIEFDEFFSEKQPHAGLVLDRCLDEWPDDTSKKGDAFAKPINFACKLIVPVCYQLAYQRWRGIMIERAKEGNAHLWCGKVDGRLFLGTGGVSPLEAAVTLHQTYGVPSLPGSALKGLTRAYASEKTDGTSRWIAQEQRDVLFGREPIELNGEWDEGDAGYVVFHDAWWLPDTNTPNPLTREIVTVHHRKYYTQKGKTAATDFDSPTPNIQVAIQGSFLFAVEGSPAWAAFALKLLKAALQDWGAGGKTAAGYGYFVEDRIQNDGVTSELMLPNDRLRMQEDKLRQEWHDKEDVELAASLGKDWNKTKQNVISQFPGVDEQRFGQILAEVYGDKLRAWETETDKHKRKAFNHCKEWLK